MDPFRPRGSDQSEWSAIDLRADGGATLGGGGLNACLLHLPVADPDPQLRLAALDRVDTVGPGLRQAIVARLGLLDIPSSLRWDDLATELLLGPPPGGWKPIRPTLEGAFEVWLGGLLKRLPVLRGGTSISENWNCADAAALTCQLTWTEVFSDFRLQTNAAELVTNGGARLASARAESDLASADHEAQIDVIHLDQTGANEGMGAAVRFAAAANTHYSVFILVNTGGSAPDHVFLRKTVTGTETDLSQVTIVGGYTAPDTVKVQINGSTLKSFLNAVEQASVTDTAITGNLRTGIVSYGGAANKPRGDNWSAADLAAAAVAPPGHGMLLSGFRNSVIQRV